MSTAKAPAAPSGRICEKARHLAFGRKSAASPPMCFLKSHNDPFRSPGSDMMKKKYRPSYT